MFFEAFLGFGHIVFQMINLTIISSCRIGLKTSSTPCFEYIQSISNTFSAYPTKPTYLKGIKFRNF